METIREKLARVLLESGRPLDVYTLRNLIGADLKLSELYAELEHVAKTLKRRGIKLRIINARCKNCGYEFNRERFKKPSKCPRCKSERISPPLFYVTSS